MFKQLVGVALGAILVSGCGDAVPAVPAPSDTTTTALSGATPPPEHSEGGFGSPARVAGEFAGYAPAPVRGELRLSGDGCWYAALGGSSHLMIFPVDFEIPAADPTTIAAPDGTVYRSGTAIDGAAFRLEFDEVPGGDAGRWGNYVTFCDPEERSIAVFESIEPAFDSAALGPDSIETIAAGAVFTEPWPCGRGWAVSTEDRMVGLFLYQRTDAEPTPGVAITLPDEAWTAELVVGKFLFVNHCDDVFEPWEPDPVIAARWQLGGGTLQILDDVPEGAEPATVRATLSGATVTTDTGKVISLDPIDLVNRSFNFFAG